jgi:hypothetical protein
VAKKDGDEEAGEEELHGRGYAAASVLTAQPVAGEELATAWPREAKDVFEVRKRSRERARDGGIERSARSPEEQDARDARTDLEGAVGDVLVRHAIAGEVKEQPERQRSEPRAHECATGRACRDVEGDDQVATLACGHPRSDRCAWSAAGLASVRPGRSRMRRMREARRLHAPGVELVSVKRPRRRARRAPTPYARRPPLLDEEEVLPAIAADAEVRTPVPDEPCDAANRPDRRTHLASRAPTWHLI